MHNSEHATGAYEQTQHRNDRFRKEFAEQTARSLLRFGRYPHIRHDRWRRHRRRTERLTTKLVATRRYCRTGTCRCRWKYTLITHLDVPPCAIPAGLTPKLHIVANPLGTNLSTGILPPCRTACQRQFGLEHSHSVVGRRCYISAKRIASCRNHIVTCHRLSSS